MRSSVANWPCENSFGRANRADKETYDAVKDALIARFGSTKSTQQYAVQYAVQHVGVQARTRSECGFRALRLIKSLRLISKAYPDIKDPATHKTLAVSFFRKALRHDIRSKIDLTMDDESATLDNLLKRAKNFEQSSSLETSSMLFRRPTSQKILGPQLQAKLKATIVFQRRKHKWKSSLLRLWKCLKAKLCLLVGQGPPLLQLSSKLVILPEIANTGILIKPALVEMQ